ncbi:MAG: hypothetical protein PHN75_02780 [Syntrophales bacterium]|nr:hypothetical protein [Syntrophales bacterium]
MKKLTDLARCKGSVVDELAQAPYDHVSQRRCIDLLSPNLKQCYKSSTMFDGEGSREADR